VVGVAGLAPNPGHAGHAPLAAAADAWTRLGRLALLSSPFWLLGMVTESLVSAGVVSFLATVSPGLLESPAARRQS
jgi:hypothetical protein